MEDIICQTVTQNQLEDNNSRKYIIFIKLIFETYLLSEIFDMLNPFATMSPIAEGSDGCAAHEDMNFVQVPQSEDHDMDPSLMSNIVVKKRRHS